MAEEEAENGERAKEDDEYVGYQRDDAGSSIGAVIVNQTTAYNYSNQYQRSRFLTLPPPLFSLCCVVVIHHPRSLSFFLSVTLLLLLLHLHLHIPSFLEFSSSSSSCFYIWTFWTHSIPNIYIYIKCRSGSGQIIKL